MFTQYYHHPLYDADKSEKYRERWFDSSYKVNSYYDKVLSAMSLGGGKNFLNSDFYSGNLPVLEDDFDLRGLKIQNRDFLFDGTKENFRGIKFDYGEYLNCTFVNVIFNSCTFNFTKFYNCNFADCSFAATDILGSEFDGCSFFRADFTEPCRWENVKFSNSLFHECFFGKKSPFVECFFDDRTHITNQAMESYHLKKKVVTTNDALSGYYQSFQSSYEASGANELALECYWEGKKAYTRYNTANKTKRYIQLAVEYVCGYGVKPVRPVMIMLLLYTFSVFIFTVVNKIPFEDSIIFTAGAIFTSGAGAEHLEQCGILSRVLYVSLAFLGICLTAIFVTTMANLWLRSKIPEKII